MDEQQFLRLQTRRQFIRQAACAALGTAALTNILGDLRIINSAMAQTSVTDYKALVCVFLSGGNDANNFILPLGSEYANYAALRQNLAIPEAAILPIAPIASDGREYGLHPSCAQLQALFAEGKMALLFNVGTLVYPLTRAQYQAGSVENPPQLFSHSDQITQWQTSIPDQQPKTGWGGRCADLLAAVQPDAKISMAVSLSGANTFEVGNVVQQFNVSTSGAVSLTGVTGARLQAVKDILGLPQSNLQQQAYSQVVDHALATGDLLNAAISATSSATYWNTVFPVTSLGNQLKMVARLIAARSALSMKRQIFFCSVGGYDTHTAQATVGAAATGAHANLLTELSGSLFAFQRAMEQIGMSESVTSFTASDFGRTFPSNGDGSDHGWGSHHCICGGAVQGRRTFGTFPVLAVNGPDDTSTGRWIPTTSVDQYSATLARWFGVSSSDLPTIFPNIGRFASSNLGFLA